MIFPEGGGAHPSAGIQIYARLLGRFQQCAAFGNPHAFFVRENYDRICLLFIRRLFLGAGPDINSLFLHEPDRARRAELAVNLRIAAHEARLAQIDAVLHTQIAGFYFGAARTFCHLIILPLYF